MWLAFALISSFCYASAGMIVRYSLDKSVRSTEGVIAIHAFGALIISLLLWLMTGTHHMPAGEALLAVSAGLLSAVGAFGYFKAYAIDDASNITLLQQMAIPMTILLSYFVLGDHISGLQVVAVMIIVIGVLLASKSHSGFHLRNKRTFLYLLFATSTWAVMGVIMRHGVEMYDVFAFNLLLVLGYAMAASMQSIFHPPTKRGLRLNLRPFNRRIIVVIVVAEAMFTLATLTQLKALSSTSTGLVFSVAASEVFFSLVIGLTLTKLWPHIIKEDIDHRTVRLKVCGAIIAVAGIVLLNR